MHVYKLYTTDGTVIKFRSETMFDLQQLKDSVGEWVSIRPREGDTYLAYNDNGRFLSDGARAPHPTRCPGGFGDGS